MDFNKNGLLIQETDSSVLAQGTGVCHYEYGNALSVGSRRIMEYCDQLSSCHILKKDVGVLWQMVGQLLSEFGAYKTSRNQGTMIKVRFN